MPRGFTERQKKLIRRRLLNAAYRQFSTFGLKKTSVDELARAAGISKGAFYLFYKSKEDLFMDVAEMAEERYRVGILETIDLPGPSPRARLFAIFMKAFELLETIPILQFFTSSDYALLFRSIPPGKLQEHLASDRMFFEELVSRCKKAGIPVKARAEEISGLMYPLVLAVMHEEELGLGNLRDSVKVLLELVAAFCLGEVDVSIERSLSSGED
jgi:AcrR family transcriptional regulator